MKHFLILCWVLAGPLLAAEIPSGGQLTLPFSEYRTLLDKARQPAPPKPPALQAVLSSRFQIEATNSAARGTVQFEILNTAEEPMLVPLIGEEATLIQVEPRETVLLRKDGFYQILMSPSAPCVVRLTMAWTPESGDNKTIYQCRVAPSAMGSLSLARLAEGEHCEVPGALQDPKTGVYHLGANPLLSFHILKAREVEVAGEVVTMPPLVSEATATMRIVSDGAFLNATRWVIRHSKAFSWRVRPGAGTEVVSASVNGRPTAPVQTPAGQLEFRIPENKERTVVELTYTGKTSPFASVRGSLSVDLPVTDLLVEKTECSLLLPSGYVPAAVEGNSDFLPSRLPNEIRLQKELSRGEAATVRIYYQKPESTK